MKKINLTVSCEEEKVKALRWYLEQKGTGIEEELSKALDTLFNRNVPANVRSYICKDAEAPPSVETPKIKKPKPNDQSDKQEAVSDA